MSATETKISEAARWLFLLVAIVVACAWFSKSSRDRQVLIQQSVEKIVDREVSQITKVIGEFLLKSDEAAFIQTGLAGRVTSMNRRAKDEIALRVGQQMEDCMPEAERQNHCLVYQQSVSGHAAGSPVFTDVKCEAYGPDGKLYPVRVQAWSNLQGGGAFITRLSKESK